MNPKVFLLSAIVLLLTVPQMAMAENVPAEMPIQAFLTDDDGVPVDGTVSVTLSIYDSPSSGTALYTDEQTLNADVGSFTAYITPERSIFEENVTLYLGMAIDGNAEMLPRPQIGAVPFATVARQATDSMTVGGMSPSSFALADHAPYTPGSGVDISGTEISLNLSCAPAQALIWDGSSWNCQDVVDYSETQRRVTGDCGAGEYITGINEDGSVECGTDQNTEYSAGAGLALNATTFSIASGGIDDSHIADSAGIDPTKIDGEAATLSGGANFSGTVSASTFESNNFEYSSGLTGLGMYSRPAYSFIDGGNPNVVYSTTASGYGFLRTTSSSRLLDLRATVTLPQNIRISTLVCRVRDTNSNEDLNFTARLRKRPHNSTTVETLATVQYSSSGSNTNIISRNDSISGGEEFDGTNHDYWIEVQFRPTSDSVGTSIRFYGCQLLVNADGPGFY